MIDESVYFLESATTVLQRTGRKQTLNNKKFLQFYDFVVLGISLAKSSLGFREGFILGKVKGLNLE